MPAREELPLQRPKTLRLADPVADRLLGLLTSHGVPHKLFDEWPMKAITAHEIPEALRTVAVRYQRMIARAIQRQRRARESGPTT